MTQDSPLRRAGAATRGATAKVVASDHRTGATGVAHILLYPLIAEIGATGASYTTCLIPIVGVAWGWLLLGEPLGWHVAAGVALE